MFQRLLFTTLLIVAAGFTNLALAQFVPNPPNPNAIPIDGGLSLLLAVCVGYGAKKIHDTRKSKSQTEEKNIAE